MNDKKRGNDDKSLTANMAFDEASERFFQTDPKEINKNSLTIKGLASKSGRKEISGKSAQGAYREWLQNDYIDGGKFKSYIQGKVSRCGLPPSMAQLAIAALAPTQIEGSKP